MDYEFQKKLLKDAEEYIRPYLPPFAILSEVGEIWWDYKSPIVTINIQAEEVYINKESIYYILRQFIRNSLKNIIKPKDLVNLLDESKEPHDYLVVLHIIFDLIRHGYFTKSQIVDMVKDTTNTRALMELIKWDDYSVFDERKERFEL